MSALLVSPDGSLVASEEPRFRLEAMGKAIRPYLQCPQPQTGDTTVIRNKDGLPLPSAFTGELAYEYLLSMGQSRITGLIK